MAYHILVVDDNEINLQLISKIFKLEGYRVTTVTNGQAALDFVKKSKPDLALLDVMMPAMDGFELCRCLRRLPYWAEIPILMLSASSDEKDRVLAKGAGATLLLGKPFDIDLLNKQIRKLLPSSK